jgi:hypothetical protein
VRIPGMTDDRAPKARLRLPRSFGDWCRLKSYLSEILEPASSPLDAVELKWLVASRTKPVRSWSSLLENGQQDRKTCKIHTS